MVGLCDCNSFYVSCERLFRPDIRTSPVIVLSNNDGCIVSLSEEAKRLGFARGMPYHQIKTAVAQTNTHVFSSNYTLYQDMSRRVMDTLFKHVGSHEVYSIDEAFFSLPPAVSDLEDFLLTLRRTILLVTGIPVSLGVARTKTLAKIAAGEAKHTGGTFILREESEKSFLEHTPIKDVWGIGWKSARKLRESGIENALDFSLKEAGWIMKHYTVTGLNTYRELQGIPSIKTPEPSSYSFCSGISFAHPLSNLEEVKASLASHCHEVSDKLIKRNLAASCVSVEIFSDRFSSSYIHAAMSHMLPYPTAYPLTLLKYAGLILDKIWKDGTPYKGSRVWVTQLEPGENQQHELFVQEEEYEKRARESALAKTIYHLGKTFGPHAIMGADTAGKTRMDYSRRNFLSPAYTTRWKDLPRAT